MPTYGLFLTYAARVYRADTLQRRARLVFVRPNDRQPSRSIFSSARSRLVRALYNRQFRWPRWCSGRTISYLLRSLPMALSPGSGALCFTNGRYRVLLPRLHPSLGLFQVAPGCKFRCRFLHRNFSSFPSSSFSSSFFLSLFFFFVSTNTRPIMTALDWSTIIIEPR